MFWLQQFKIFFPLSIKMIDYSQIISLYTFIGSPYLYDIGHYFDMLRVDNFILFPSIPAQFFSQQIHHKTYILVNKQEAPPSMMQNRLSSSFLVNYAPILLEYLIILCIILILFRVPKISIHVYYLKKFFKYNSIISLFFLTFQETILYFVLQYKNPDFSTAFNITSFIFC